jgi:hypothetical protein
MPEVEQDDLTNKAMSPARALRIKQRIARGLVLFGAAPLALLALGFVLAIITGCGFDNDPDYCNDLNHPAVMIPMILMMLGMYGVFTLPILVFGLVLLARYKRQDRPSPD